MKTLICLLTLLLSTFVLSGKDILKKELGYTIGDKIDIVLKKLDSKGLSYNLNNQSGTYKYYDINYQNIKFLDLPLVTVSLTFENNLLKSMFIEFTDSTDNVRLVDKLEDINDGQFTTVDSKNYYFKGKKLDYYIIITFAVKKIFVVNFG